MNTKQTTINGLLEQRKLLCDKFPIKCFVSAGSVEREIERIDAMIMDLNTEPIVPSSDEPPIPLANPVTICKA